MEKYQISPEDCLILLALRSSSSLREASRLLGCDPGGLLRKVQRLAADHDVVAKVDGKWTLTKTGRALVGWTKGSILSQKKLLLSESSLRIVATAWFAEMVLIPGLNDLRASVPGVKKTRIATAGRGFERSLIEGEADFVIVCHPPQSPSIAHKQIVEERWSAVVSPDLIATKRKGTRKPTVQDLESIDFIHHNEINPDIVFQNLPATRDVSVSVDNLISVRAAVGCGHGWSFVPTILVEKELRSGHLIEIEHSVKMGRKLCVWWLRASYQSRRQAPALCRWLLDATSAATTL